MEVALSVVLLLGAGLVVRSYANLRNVDPGFDGENVLAVSLLPSPQRYPDVAAQTSLYDRVLELVAALPGVRAAGVITEPPLAGPPSTWSLLRPGRELADDHVGVHWNPARRRPGHPTERRAEPAVAVRDSQPAAGDMRPRRRNTPWLTTTVSTDNATSTRGTA